MNIIIIICLISLKSLPFLNFKWIKSYKMFSFVSCSMVGLWFIHVGKSISSSFFIAMYYPIIWKYDYLFIHCTVGKWGFPSGTSSKELASQCRRCKRPELDPWVGRIPWRRAWQPTLVFLPGESPWTEEPGGLQFLGHKNQTWLSD